MGLLDGKVAIVTGAGNGVGRGEAIELADQGAKVVVNDLGVSVTGEGADKRTADEVVDVIKSRGGEAVANYDDVADFNGAKSIIDSLELTRYGVRANCIGPGGFTRMVGQARSDITIKNPEEYTEFDGMNPGNSAPAVAWLASDESKPTTGQVLRMVGNSLCVYQPWQMGEEFFATDAEGNPARWDPADVGNILNKYVFHTIN